MPGYKSVLFSAALASLLIASTALAQQSPSQEPPPQPPPVQPAPPQPPPTQPVAPQPPPTQPVAQQPVAHQPPPRQLAPPPHVLPKPARDGFIIGFSLGFGAMSVSDCDACESLEGFAFDFSIGGMLNPNLALMFDAAAVIHVDTEAEATLSNSTNTIALQAWVAPKIWIKGGLGFSVVSVSGEFIESQSERGFGLTAAAGYEISNSGSFGMDIQLRLGHSSFDDGDLTNVGFMIGFNWY